MKAQEIVLCEERNVTLTAYIQEVDGEFGFAKRPAMLVIPGGGYACVCHDWEGTPIAARLTGDEIVSDSLLALHKNHPEIKIMYCCSVQNKDRGRRLLGGRTSRGLRSYGGGT